jgi:6-phospho 3-hexuloisomerase
MTIRFYASQASKLAEELDGNAIDRFVELVRAAREGHRKVYVCGTGRSRLVGAAFAMRLMHLGLRVHVIGEVTMPAVERDDVVVAISGSGETSLTVGPVQAAHGRGARVVAITSERDSALGRMADAVIIIHGRVRESKETSYIARQLTSQLEHITPMGSLFEILALIFLEGVIFHLQNALSQTPEDMRKRHANIE